ncbi:MAG: glycosyltransferase family 2 protein [Chloroflexi bacterium]|nr:glycosyltransferase family 2 protein [Chloroflexota bacterium]
MRLAVIIVSYNTRDLLRSCLYSVLDSAALSADQLAVDVIVVDNASRDDSIAMVAAEFPQIHLVASPNNLGYTGGNNLALKLLGFNVTDPVAPAASIPVPQFPDFVLLLNPDTEIVGNALAQMANCLRDQPELGACGANLRYGQGQFQHGAFRFPSLFQVALDFFPLTGLPGVHRLHNSRFNGRYPAQLWRGMTPFPVDFVLGAALMVRGAAIQQVGGLDPEFFMYCEEMDWCFRLKAAGWAIYAVPTAHVIHYEGQSSRQVRWSAYERLWRSRFRFYAKHQAYYFPAHLALVRLLVRLGIGQKIWRAQRRFAQGQVTGEALQTELAAYAKITQL